MSDEVCDRCDKIDISEINFLCDECLKIELNKAKKQGALEELENQLKWIDKEINWYLGWEENNVSNDYNIAQRKCLERVKKRLIEKRLKELNGSDLK
jgi:hypothetical protein